MKKAILIALFIFIGFLVGCGKERGELNNVSNISPEEIFNQKEDKYYVYFHRIDCADCEESAPYVINYSQIIKEYDGCKDKRKIYAVLLFTSTEKPGQDTYIYREYTGEGGQGTDGKYFVDGVANWKDLYIASTSSLISVSKNSSGVKVAKYIAQGAEAVIEALNTQLGTCFQ
ncbi:MAG: hypothetical protein AB7T03_01275 [Bacilli bacterium]